MPRITRTPEQIEAARLEKNRRARERRAARAAGVASGELIPVIDLAVGRNPNLPAGVTAEMHEGNLEAVAETAAENETELAPSSKPAPSLDTVRTIAFRQLPEVGEIGLAVHKCHRAGEWELDGVVAAIMAAEGVESCAFQLYDNRAGWLWSHGEVALKGGKAVITQIG